MKARLAGASAGDSICDEAATKSPRKVLRSSPGAHHFHVHFIFNGFRRYPFVVSTSKLRARTPAGQGMSIQAIKKLSLQLF